MPGAPKQWVLSELSVEAASGLALLDGREGTTALAEQLAQRRPTEIGGGGGHGKNELSGMPLPV